MDRGFGWMDEVAGRDGSGEGWKGAGVSRVSGGWRSRWCEHLGAPKGSHHLASFQPPPRRSSSTVSSPPFPMAPDRPARVRKPKTDLQKEADRVRARHRHQLLSNDPAYLATKRGGAHQPKTNQLRTPVYVRSHAPPTTALDLTRACSSSYPLPVSSRSRPLPPSPSPSIHAMAPSPSPPAPVASPSTRRPANGRTAARSRSYAAQMESGDEDSRDDFEFFVELGRAVMEEEGPSRVGLVLCELNRSTRADRVHIASLEARSDASELTPEPESPPTSPPSTWSAKMTDALARGPAPSSKEPSAPRPPKPASGGRRAKKEPEVDTFVYLTDADEKARRARLAAWIKLRPSRVKKKKRFDPKVERVAHEPRHVGQLPTELEEVYRLNYTLIGMDIKQKDSRQYAAADRTAHEKWMRLLDDYYTHVDDKVSSTRPRSLVPLLAGD